MWYNKKVSTIQKIGDTIEVSAGTVHWQGHCGRPCCDAASGGLLRQEFPKDRRCTIVFPR